MEKYPKLQRIKVYIQISIVICKYYHVAVTVTIVVHMPIYHVFTSVT